MCLLSGLFYFRKFSSKNLKIEVDHCRDIYRNNYYKNLCCIICKCDGNNMIMLLKILIFLLNPVIGLAQNVDVNSRINCFPEIINESVNKTACINRGCLFDDQVDYVDFYWKKFQVNFQNTKIPQCYYPPNTGYTLESSSTNSLTLKKSPSSVKNPYGQDFDELLFSWEEIGAGIHLTIAPKNSTRWIKNFFRFV